MNEEQRNRAIGILEAYKEQYSDQIKLMIPNFLSKKFNSLYSIHTDIEHLISAESELSEIIKAETVGLIEGSLQTVKTALWYSIVAIYGKCFTQNDASKTKLEPSQCFKERPDLLVTHEKLMRIRHGYVAHRGDNEFDVSLVMLMYPSSAITDENQAEVRVIGIREVWPSLNELAEYADLFKFIKEHVEQRLEMEGPKLTETYLNFLNSLEDHEKAHFIFK